MADLVYDSFMQHVALGDIDLKNDDIKCCLLGADHVPSSAHTHLSDLGGEVVGDGYIAGGMSLQAKRVERIGSKTTFTAANVIWPVVSVYARYAALYDNTKDDKPLICLFDFGVLKIITDGMFCLNFDPDEGIVSLSAL